jgi:hypothetical protein
MDAAQLSATSRRLVLDLALLDLLDRLRVASDGLAALVDDIGDAAVVERWLGECGALTADAECLGHRRLALVGHAAQRLLEACALARGAGVVDLVALVVRANELMTLLVHDARRQLDGHAPAALHGAVEVFIEHAAAVVSRHGSPPPRLVH